MEGGGAFALIVQATTPDTSAWREECAIDGFSLDPVRQGISRGLERRGETWVRQDNGTQYGILRVPGCAVEHAAIPELPIAPSLQQALPDGSVVYVTMERGAAAQQHWLLRRGSNDPRRLEVPEAQVDRGPLVSEDGGWVAWVTRSPGRAASITSAAMDARGRYVAASTTTSLSIGSIRDTIVALRTRDGGEVFRRALPTYARSQVAFLGDGYFAYSDVEGTHSRTRVLRITD